MLEEASKRKVPVHRVSQGSGIMLMLDDKISEMLEIGRKALMEVNPTYDPVSDTLYVNGNPYDVAVQFADQADPTTSTLNHLVANDIFVLFPGDSPASGASPGLYIQETTNGGGTNILALGAAPSM